MVYGF
jgi:hypothetical protein